MGNEIFTKFSGLVEQTELRSWRWVDVVLIAFPAHVSSLFASTTAEAFTLSLYQFLSHYI